MNSPLTRDRDILQGSIGFLPLSELKVNTIEEHCRYFVERANNDNDGVFRSIMSL
jgi:hypothetical protein